jgi:hypothetical protein
MKTKHSTFRESFQWFSRLVFLSGVCWVCSGYGQAIPVRLSFKFILNASGNRPATGDVNTDAEVTAQVDRANRMFAQHISELRQENLEIINVAGISQYYYAEPTTSDRDSLRAAAMANPSLYHWRNDCINVYISAGSGASASAISKFPPDNDIILVSQAVWDNMLAHEVGHSLNLLHTHQSGGDGCSDTLNDNDTWNRDDIALNNFSKVYSQLTTSQQDQVDLTWFNVMSYHNGNTAFRLSPQQMDRSSAQADSDRGWLLSRTPVYVNSAASPLFANGTFALPYPTIQQAMSSGTLNNRVLVLQRGTHARPSTLDIPTDIITRAGESTVRDQPPPYVLPNGLERSTNAAVRDAIIRVQECDRLKDASGAITNLLQAEKSATGREKSAIQLELAQRLRDSGKPDEAAAWYTRLSQETDQEALRKDAVRRAEAMKQEAAMKQKQEQGPQRKGKTN